MALKTIINLHAEWCQPCKAFAPIFENVSKNDKFKDIIFESYDIESNKGTELTEGHSVRAVPTTLFLDEKDREIKRISGTMTENEFETIIENINKE